MVDGPTAQPTSDAAFRSALKSQYHASLAMLRQALELCDDVLWTDPTPTNAFWQVAYHALYFTHLYLMPGVDAFVPWKGQHPAQHVDGIPGRADPDSSLPLVPAPYTRDEVLAYWRVVDGAVDGAVDGLDLTRAECGFPWYDMPKLEHQLVNLRHVQHHAAQLADRLRAANDVGVRWVGKGRGA